MLPFCHFFFSSLPCSFIFISFPGLFPHLNNDLIGPYQNIPHDCGERSLGDIHVLLEMHGSKDRPYGPYL